MKLTQYLDLAGITIEAFAKQAGVHKSTMGRIVREKHQPSWDTMLAIEKASNGAVTPNDMRPEK